MERIIVSMVMIFWTVGMLSQVSLEAESNTLRMAKDGTSSQEGNAYFYYDDAELIRDVSYKESDTQPHLLWSQGDLRLVTGFDSEIISSAGRLEIYYTPQYTANVENEEGWGTVCGNEFTNTAANVACRQLGFESALGWNYTANTPFAIANDSMPIILDEVNCPASYLWHLLRCNHNLLSLGSSDTDCTHEQDVAVFCSSERIWDDPYNGQVRLMGISNTTIHSYGRVEVYQNGEWGTVCNEGFDQAGADSACRQLGYTGALYTGDALPGSGVISVKGITCDSSSPCFTTCFNRHMHIHDCNHTQDIAIQCGFNVNEASEYTAGYSNACAINNFPVSLLVLCIMLSLGFLLVIGCGIVFLITFTRCCVRCCRRTKRYEELM